MEQLINKVLSRAAARSPTSRSRFSAAARSMRRSTMSAPRTSSSCASSSPTKAIVAASEDLGGNYARRVMFKPHSGPGFRQAARQRSPVPTWREKKSRMATRRVAVRGRRWTISNCSRQQCGHPILTGDLTGDGFAHYRIWLTIPVLGFGNAAPIYFDPGARLTHATHAPSADRQSRLACGRRPPAGSRRFTLLALYAGARLVLVGTAGAQWPSARRLLLALAGGAASTDASQRKLAALGRRSARLADATAPRASVLKPSSPISRRGSSGPSQFKAALPGLQQPALLLSADGEILGVTSRPGARSSRAPSEGATLDALFGTGYLARWRYRRRRSGRRSGTHRFGARRRQCRDRTLVLELTPAGHYIADDDLDAFAAALAGGQTGFPLRRRGARRNRRRCARSGTALEKLRRGRRALAQLRAGRAARPAMLRANSGIAPQVRELERSGRSTRR